MNDPVGATGDGHGNPAVATLHTQDPRRGLDDRFDLRLASDGLLDGVGRDYVPGTYRVAGNNGSHELGAAITTGTGAPQEVLAALAEASDHLPVVAEYDYGLRAGDANGDGGFDQLDVVAVLVARKYLTGEVVAWSEGDWTGDRRFDQRDLVEALRVGEYQAGGPVRVVPEPGAGLLFATGVVAVGILLIWSRRFAKCTATAGNSQRPAAVSTSR